MFYLTPQELAQRLHVSRATVYRWIRRGQIPSIQIERDIRIPDSVLEAPRELLMAPFGRTLPEMGFVDLSAFWRAAGALPVGTKRARAPYEVLRMRYCADGRVRMSYAEIGEIWSVSRQAAHASVRSALLAVSKLLKGDADEDLCERIAQSGRGPAGGVVVPAGGDGVGPGRAPGG